MTKSTIRRSRRARADSINGTVAAARSAMTNTVPPGHIALSDDDWPFWRSVVAEFAGEEITPHVLEVAAFLARTMADLDREQKALRTEGAILKTEKGALLVNPRDRVVKTLCDSVLSLRRSLALHARARAGETRDIAKRRGINKGTEKATQSKSDLIP